MTKPAPRRRFPVVPMAVAGFVVLAAAIAIGVSVATSGKEASVDEPISAQQREVTVEGTPLVQRPAESGVADPALGVKAPLLLGTSFDGTVVEVAPAAGQRRLLVFLAHWCPHCRREVPRLVEWNESGAKPANLTVTGVSTGVDRSLPNYPPSAWLERERWPFPVLVDDAANSAAVSYGVSGFPFLVLVDANGDVVARASGEKSLEELTAFVTIGAPR